MNEALKKQVGLEAAKLVKNDMIVGLGTGSTVSCFVDALKQRMIEEGLTFSAVTTSRVTSEQAQSLGLKLVDLAAVDTIDLTVDGADEVDPALNGIKGGGGALLMEKIVAAYSQDYVWIIDESKKVEKLGSFPLPVEVIKYGAENLFRAFEGRDYRPTWRLTPRDNTRLITDQGHFIIDLHLSALEAPYQLADTLDRMVGVVEHGLFLDMAQRVIIAGTEGIDSVSRG